MRGAVVKGFVYPICSDIIPLMNENNNLVPLPGSDSSAQAPGDQAASLQRIIAELSPLRTEDRRRLIETVSTFFGLNLARSEASGHVVASLRPSTPTDAPFQFSEEAEAPSPKSFMLCKSPQTDVERVACLAYYLAHYRGTSHFKTKDITLLNTESAHRAFSNPTVAVDNATKTGYLVPSVKGCKQLSASGEQFVEALPDREAAKEILERSRHRRGGRPGKKNNTKPGRE